MNIRGNELRGCWVHENMSFPACFTSLIAIFIKSHLACTNTSAKYRYRSTWALLISWQLTNHLGYLQSSINHFNRKKFHQPPEKQTLGRIQQLLNQVSALNHPSAFICLFYSNALIFNFCHAKGKDLLGYESTLETLNNFFKKKYCVEKSY